MSTWQDRVRGYIKLISPKGTEFTPGWRGDTVSGEKKVGQHDAPMVDGTITQDLGMKGLAFPLTLLFEGVDNDKDAWKFAQTLSSERGPWTVVHPVLGSLTLQPLSFSCPFDPIGSGNISVITTSWIEPKETAQDSTPVPASDVFSAADDAAVANAEAFAEAPISELTQLQSLSNTIKANIATVKSAMSQVSAKAQAIIRQVQSEIASTEMDLLSIAGEVTSLLQAPGMASGMLAGAAKSMSLDSDITALLTSSSSVISLSGKTVTTSAQVNSLAAIGLKLIDAMSVMKTDNSKAVKSAAMSHELCLNGMIVSMAKVIASQLPETRVEAVSIIESFGSFIDSVTAICDTISTATAGFNLEEQYIVSSGVSEAVSNLRASVNSYLLSVICNLKIEKKIILDRPRTTLEVAITEYGATAETADFYYDLFCRSNNLHGRDVLHLGQGREVAVYV
jgi:prophage DNA circulation protein